MFDLGFEADIQGQRRHEPHPAVLGEKLRKGAKFAPKVRKPLPDAVERESYKPRWRSDATDEFSRYGHHRELIAVLPNGGIRILARSRNHELLVNFYAGIREYCAMHRRVVALGGPPPLSLMPRGDALVAEAALKLLSLGPDVEVSVR